MGLLCRWFVLFVASILTLVSAGCSIVSRTQNHDLLTRSASAITRKINSSKESKGLELSEIKIKAPKEIKRKPKVSKHTSAFYIFTDNPGNFPRPPTHHYKNQQKIQDEEIDFLLAPPQFPSSSNKNIVDSSQYLTGATLDRIGLSGVSDVINGTASQVERKFIRPLDSFRTFKYRGLTTRIQPPKINERLDEVYLSLTIDF